MSSKTPYNPQQSIFYAKRIRSGKAFLLDLNQIYHFINNIYQLPSTMLVSRLVTRFLTLRTLAAFAPPSSSFLYVQNKALDTKSLGEFNNFAKQNSKELTGDVLASVSRHISLLLNARGRAFYEEANEFIEIIKVVDLSSLSLRNANGILSLLRSFKNRGYNSAQFNNFRTSLTSRIIALVQSRQQTEQDIGDLVNAYAELTFFRVKETKQVADKLLKLLEAASLQGRSGLTDSQISFLLWGLSIRPELGLVESRIRSHVLKEIGKQLGSFKLYDLVKIASNINKTDLFDLDNNEFQVLKQITDRLMNSITELDERNIYELIKSENVGKMPGIYRIYEEICHNLFNQIEEGGETEIGPEPTFRIITYLSDKIQLAKLSDLNKKKFFAFLDRYGRFCGEDQTRKKLLGFKLKDLITNDFFSGNDKDRLTKIFHTYGAKLNSLILYEMAIRDYDLSLFSNDILAFPLESLVNDSLVRMGIVSYKLANMSNTPENKAYYESIQAKLGEQLETPEKFVDFYKKLSRMEVNPLNFYDAFSGLVEKLPNPLENTVNVANYRSFYLKLINDGKRQRDYNAFFIKNDAAITGEDLSELILHHIRNDPRELQYKRQLLQMVNKRVYDLIESNNKKWVESLIELASKYCRLVVGGNLDNNSENTIFRILHCLIGKWDLITELGLDPYLISTLEKYLLKSHKSYNVESNYRQLVKHLVIYLERLTVKKSFFAGNIVKEALRLGLLTKESLEKVDLEKLSLRFFERARAQYVKDPTYAPVIEKISIGSLDIIFSNHNLQNLLGQSEKQIIEIIQKTSPIIICGYLVNYCHNKSPASKRILSQMLNIIVAKLNNFDRVDIIGFLQNALDNNLYHFNQYKKITDKLIEQFRKRLDAFSIDTHLALIKFIISQPGFNPKEYYIELIEFAEKQKGVSEGQYEQILLRLANTKYRFRDSDLQYVEKIIKKTPHSGLFFFLMAEPSMSPEAKSKAVKHFVDKINDYLKSKEQTMSRIQYHYLKKNYPAETATLNFDEKSLYSQYYLVKPKNTELVDTIVKLAGGKSEELTVLGIQNYLLKINKTVLAFNQSKRIGSFHEQDFIKRAINSLAGEDLNVYYLFMGNQNSSTLEYINKQCPELFDQTEYQKALAEYKSNIRRKAEPFIEE